MFNLGNGYCSAGQVADPVSGECITNPDVTSAPTTPTVQTSSMFSWGTLGLMLIAGLALFASGFASRKGSKVQYSGALKLKTRTSSKSYFD